MATKIEPLHIEDVSLAAMAVDDARKTLLIGGASGRVRLHAISAVLSCGKSLREASTAVDHVLLHDIRP
jgi:hypothetical protein